MPRPVLPKVVTANALRDGGVIYLTAEDSWSADLARAEVLTDEAHAQLRLIEASRRSAEAVGVYLTDIRQTAQGPEPVHFRDLVRLHGPSNDPHTQA